MINETSGREVEKRPNPNTSPISIGKIEKPCGCGQPGSIVKDITNRIETTAACDNPVFLFYAASSQANANGTGDFASIGSTIIFGKRSGSVSTFINFETFIKDRLSFSSGGNLSNNNRLDIYNIDPCSSSYSKAGINGTIYDINPKVGTGQLSGSTVNVMLAYPASYNLNDFWEYDPSSDPEDSGFSGLISFSQSNLPGSTPALQDMKLNNILYKVARIGPGPYSEGNSIKIQIYTCI
jgi:hypothetical protein